jgi:hypothetical protein
VLTYLIPLGILAIGVALWLTWALLGPARLRQQVARARVQFESRRCDYQRQFLAAASATGKPRGLAWKTCDLHDGLLLARDRATHELIALVSVTISFEAIEGGGMEEVEAVGNLRAATAVFHWNGRDWTTQGRAVFNLEPREALERYGESLEPVDI